MTMLWTEYQDNQLLSLLGRMTYTEIGKILGKSKNAISGRVNRLAKTIKEPTVFVPKRNPHNRPMEAFTAYGNPASLKDIKKGQCVFPVAETNLFCAAEANGVYCKNHARITGRKYDRKSS